jgi:hypothetical protein
MEDGFGEDRTANRLPSNFIGKGGRKSAATMVAKFTSKFQYVKRRFPVTSK